MIDLDTDGLTYEIEGHTAYVTFDRPEKHNAMTPSMMSEGGRALRDADRREEVRAIIVTGAGEEAFSAGADLEQTIPGATADARGEGEDDAPEEAEPPEEDPPNLFIKNDLITTPIVSAVNGICVAGGMEFIQATDIRIAEEHARFGLQEPVWGLAPGGGSHVRLPRQIPFAYAMEYLLTGDLFPAEHAHGAGLVNEVVPKGESLSRAEEVAESIAQNGPYAVRKIKETVLRGLDKSREDAFRLEDEETTKVFAHPHAEEGPRAFSEGREPSYRP